MNIISKAALLMLIVGTSADKAPTLRGVAQPTSEEIKDIIRQAKVDAFVAVMEADNTERSCSKKNCAASTAAGYDYCTAGNTKYMKPMCGPCDMDTGHCSWPPKGFNIDKERTIVDSLSKEELLDIFSEVMYDPVHKATSAADNAAHKATSAANKASNKATAAADKAADKATAAADKAAETARKAACFGSHCD